MTPFIRWIESDEATGLLAALYADWKAANPQRDDLPGILKCLSLRPEMLRGVMDAAYHVHFSDGFLTRRCKEMIATLVSGLNRCPY